MENSIFCAVILFSMIDLDKMPRFVKKRGRCLQRAATFFTACLISLFEKESRVLRF